MLFLLLLLLERWIEYRDAWMEVSWPFSARDEDMVYLPVPIPISVTITGVKRPLARFMLSLERIR